jgi:hypothetical protein
MADNSKFEDSIRQAFSKAEYPPSDQVWTGIELELEKANLNITRKKLRMMQWLAAASLVLAAGSSVLYFLASPKGAPNPPATAQVSVLPPAVSPLPRAIEPSAKIPHTREHGSEDLTFNKPLKSSHYQQDNEVRKSFTLLPTAPAMKPAEQEVYHRTVTFNPYQHLLGSHLLDIKKPDLPVREAVLPTHVAQSEVHPVERHAKRKEGFWAAVDVGAGTFNPNVSHAPQGLQVMRTVSAAPLPESSAGYSYSAGAQAGFRLSRHVVLQGGLLYLQQQATYGSSTVQQQQSAYTASLNELATRADNLVVTAPYLVESTLQFVSLPVQAGYVLVDRSFALTLNGGVAADFFLQNTLTPSVPGLARSVITAGENSPYRSVLVNGMVSTELSYRAGKHYRIAIAPGMRYALQSVYRPDVHTDLSPITYQVAFRVKYHFN